MMKAISQVIPEQEINAVLKNHNLEEGVDFIQQLKSTAFLYELPGDTFVIFNHNEDYGLLVNGRANVEKMIAEDFFPIELEPKRGQPIEYEKQNILQIQDKADHFRNLLNTKTGLSYDTVTEQALKDYLRASFTLRKQNKLGHDGLIALTSIVGEYAIARFDGKWALHKVYWSGYNPSFEPEVIKSNSKVMPIYFYVLQFLQSSTPDIELFLQQKFDLSDPILNHYQKTRNLLIFDGSKWVSVSK